jgi:hypothetical protein
MRCIIVQILSTILPILTVGCTTSRIPERSMLERSLPPPEASIIKAEGRVSLPNITEVINRTIPRNFSDSNSVGDACKLEVSIFGMGTSLRLGDVDYEIRVSRSDLKVSDQNGSLVISGDLEVWARADCIIKFAGRVITRVSESTDPKGLIHLDLIGNFSAGPLYSVSPSLQATHSWLRAPGFKILWDLVPITIQGKADDALKKQIPTSLRDLESQLAKINFKDQAKKVWDGLHEPLNLQNRPNTDPIWASSRPLSTHIGSLRTDSQYVRLGAAIRSMLRVFIGKQPDMSDLVALPILDSQLPPGNIKLSIPMELGYEEIATKFKDQLVNNPITVPEGTFKFRDFEMYQANEKLAVGIQFSAKPKWFLPISGWLYVLGVPEVDTSRNILRLTSLEYEAHFYNPIYYAIMWVFEPQFRRQLQEKAQLDLTLEIDELKRRINNLPPKDVSPDVKITGHIDDIRLNYFIPNRDRISAGASATGDITADFILNAP